VALRGRRDGLEVAGVGSLLLSFGWLLPSARWGERSSFIIYRRQRHAVFERGAFAILRSAQRELAELPIPVYERVWDAILDLSENPRPIGCLKLRGRKGWRIRVGDYRVGYERDDRAGTVTVLHIGHRRDVYR
jgi:mRNA interferase RelE/StbE